ncbi:MAG: hypothetical protein M3Z24_09415 [Chloroflexota bacterium]|nr:hypothetical protein [Chloroflexota bacterium]
MAEGILQPGVNNDNGVIANEESRRETQQDIPARNLPPIIWTPHFIILFILTLVLGLTADSLLTKGWINHFYAGGWVQLVQTLLLLGCWITIIRHSRTWEMRMGGIFGCIWSIFSIITSISSFFNPDPGSPMVIHLQLALSSALLGCYICLSIDRIPLDIWDSWFFRLALGASIAIPLLIFVFSPTDIRSLSTLENSITITLLSLCLLVWWARPRCWKISPGPTFLFGTVPALLLLLSIPQGASMETTYFISLVSLLSLLLGILRVLQGELQHAPIL